MKDQPDNEPRAKDSVNVDERLVCDVCGRFGAVELGDRRLCLDCYEGSGSCCPEFGCGEAEQGGDR